MSQNPSAKEQLAAHFDKSATVVRAYADKFEAAYARPALKTTTAFFDEYPISSTFIAIFSSLAFFPVTAFLGLSIFTISSFSFVALCCAFIASAAVVLLFLSVLILSLVTMGFASAFFTVFTISTYLGYRFAVLVRSKGREGISSWASETKGRFIQSARREASGGSAVVVAVEEPQAEWVKDDSFGSDTKDSEF
ncbi:hypothetical protein B0H10DRAFT_218272 [Mycena sp. CBHHK59/15]|nr:hypothetical protein B0H10DRAFT_218272 [Mycena sp. CBHHK59/15]